MVAMRLVNALVCHVYIGNRDNFAYCSSSCCDTNDAIANGWHNYTDRFVAVYSYCMSDGLLYVTSVVGRPFCSLADATNAFI